MISLHPDVVETLFLAPDGHTYQGMRRVCEQHNGYGVIEINTQTGESITGRLCTLVLQDIDDETYWGVDFKLGIANFGGLETTNSFPWRPALPRPKLIELRPLDRAVIVTYTPRRTW